MSQHLMGAKETLDVCGRLREGFCADIQTVMSSVEDSKVSSEWNDAPVYMELVRHVHTFVTYAGQVPDGPDHSREIFQVRAQAFEQAYVNVIRGNMVSNAKKHPILQEMIEKAAIDLQQKMEELKTITPPSKVLAKPSPPRWSGNMKAAAPICRANWKNPMRWK